jgi:hypothetical protein
VIDETDESFQRPDDDEVAETTEATRIALEKLTAAKVFFLFILALFNFIKN